MGKCWSKTDIHQGSRETLLFSLKDYQCNAKIVYVYDGDTVHIVFPFRNMNGKKVLRRWKCRLEHIDTPELRTKDEKEKEMGYFVRNVLIRRILHQTLQVKCGAFDKYGRLLLTIYTPTNCKEDWTIDGIFYSTVNEWLIGMKYAQPYEGKTKQKWTFSD